MALKSLQGYLEYNSEYPDSILNYAKRLMAQKLSFNDIICLQLEYSKSNELPEGIVPFKKNNGKGALGNALEECYFGIKNNSRQEPDFPVAGVELKCSPLDKKSGKYVPGERISVTSLDINSELEKDFFNSYVWHKIQKMLIVFYYRDKKKSDVWDYSVRDVLLFSPSGYDIKVMIDDYNYIMEKVEKGQFEKISEADTNCFC